jgi:hypothetical protein
MYKMKLSEIYIAALIRVIFDDNAKTLNLTVSALTERYTKDFVA